MPRQSVKIGFDMSEFDDLIKKLERAQKKEFRQKLAEWLEISGMEFLDIVIDEIHKTNTIDTKRLLKSFTRGEAENIFKIQYGGLQLEIGTDVPYAAYVNDGHWTTSAGVAQRWVPGRWEGNKFRYDPNAKTGMLLKRKWVNGKHYWESAISIFEKMFEKRMDERLQEWIDEYFG